VSRVPYIWPQLICQFVQHRLCRTHKAHSIHLHG
jgi:hypothetical protein